MQKASSGQTEQRSGASSYCCALCAGQIPEIVGEWDRNGAALTTVICVRCGLVSHAQIPSDQELAAFYYDSYRQEYNRELTPSPKRVVREWRRGQERFELVRRYLRPNDQIFEIGAGIGCNLKPFEFAGHRTSGIEPGGGFSDYSRGTMRCQIKTALLNELTEHAEYDVVLLIHVLEHLPEPRRALEKIRQLLRTEGRLYVEVPNLAAPHAAPGKIFHRAHLYNFTPWTLGMLANASGFEVTHVLSTEHDRNLKVWLTRRSSKEWHIDSTAMPRTMQALRRYSRLSYHLRSNYLRERFYECLDRLSQWWGQKQAYAEILRTCSEFSPARAATKVA